MTTKTLIDEIRAHAVENYNEDGWDYLVECWGDDEIIEAIGPTAVNTVEEAIYRLKPTLKTLDNYRREIKSTVW